MRGFVDRMMALERHTPRLLSLSAIHGFMAGDVPEIFDQHLVGGTPVERLRAPAATW